MSHCYKHKGKHIMVWENGDYYGDGHTISINPNNFRTWNGILAFITKTLRPSFGAVRNLIHLERQALVDSFGSLESNAKYVAVGSERLKLVPNCYKTFAEKQNVQQPRRYSDNGSQPSISGVSTRGRKTILFVMTNGKSQEMPCKVVLTEADLGSWTMILEYISRSLDIPEGIKYLYTVFGEPVVNPKDIQNGCIYVAVPQTERFINMSYIRIFRSILPMREIDLKGVEEPLANPPPINYPISYNPPIEVAKSKSEGLTSIRPTNKNIQSIKCSQKSKQYVQRNVRPCYVPRVPRLYCRDRRIIRKDTNNIVSFVRSLVYEIIDKLPRVPTDKKIASDKTNTDVAAQIDSLPIIQETPSIDTGICDLTISTVDTNQSGKPIIFNTNARSISELHIAMITHLLNQQAIPGTPDTTQSVSESKEIQVPMEGPQVPDNSIRKNDSLKNVGLNNQEPVLESPLPASNFSENKLLPKGAKAIPCPYINKSMTYAQGGYSGNKRKVAKNGTKDKVSKSPLSTSSFPKNRLMPEEANEIPCPIINESMTSAQDCCSESKIEVVEKATKAKVSECLLPTSNFSENRLMPEGTIEIPCPYINKSVTYAKGCYSGIKRKVVEKATNDKVSKSPHSTSHSPKNRLMPERANEIPCPNMNESMTSVQGCCSESKIEVVEKATKAKVSEFPPPMSNFSENRLMPEGTIEIPCPYINKSVTYAQGCYSGSKRKLVEKATIDKVSKSPLSASNFPKNRLMPEEANEIPCSNINESMTSVQGCCSESKIEVVETATKAKVPEFPLPTSNFSENRLMPEGAIEIPCPYINKSVTYAKGCYSGIKREVVENGRKDKVSESPMPTSNFSENRLMPEVAKEILYPNINESITSAQGCCSESKIKVVEMATKAKVSEFPLPTSNFSENRLMPEGTIEIPCPYKNKSMTYAQGRYSESKREVVENGRKDKVSESPMPTSNFSENRLMPEGAKAIPYPNINESITSAQGCCSESKIEVVERAAKDKVSESPRPTSNFSENRLTPEEANEIPCPYKNKSMTYAQDRFSGSKREVVEKATKDKGILESQLYMSNSKEVTRIPCTSKGNSITSDQGSERKRKNDTLKSLPPIPSILKDKEIKAIPSLLSNNISETRPQCLESEITNELIEQASHISNLDSLRPHRSSAPYAVGSVSADIKSISNEIYKHHIDIKDARHSENRCYPSMCGFKKNYGSNRPKILQTPTEFIDDLIRSCIIIMEQANLLPLQRFSPMVNNESGQKYARFETRSEIKLREKHACCAEKLSTVKEEDDIFQNFDVRPSSIHDQSFKNPIVESVSESSQDGTKGKKLRPTFSQDLKEYISKTNIGHLKRSDIDQHDKTFQAIKSHSNVPMVPSKTSDSSRSILSSKTNSTEEAYSMPFNLSSQVSASKSMTPTGSTQDTYNRGQATTSVKSREMVHSDLSKTFSQKSSTNSMGHTSQISPSKRSIQETFSIDGRNIPKITSSNESSLHNQQNATQSSNLGNRRGSSLVCSISSDKNSIVVSFKNNAIMSGLSNNSETASPLASNTSCNGKTVSPLASNTSKMGSPMASHRSNMVTSPSSNRGNTISPRVSGRISPASKNISYTERMENLQKSSNTRSLQDQQNFTHSMTKPNSNRKGGRSLASPNISQKSSSVPECCNKLLKRLEITLNGDTSTEIISHSMSFQPIAKPSRSRTDPGVKSEDDIEEKDVGNLLYVKNADLTPQSSKMVSVEHVQGKVPSQVLNNSNILESHQSMSNTIQSEPRVQYSQSQQKPTSNIKNIIPKSSANLRENAAQSRVIIKEKESTSKNLNSSNITPSALTCHTHSTKSQATGSSLLSDQGYSANNNNVNPYCEFCCNSHKKLTKETKEHRSRILDVPNIREFKPDHLYEDVWNNDERYSEEKTNQSIVTVLKLRKSIQQGEELQRCPSASLNVLTEDNSDDDMIYNGSAVTCHCRRALCQCAFSCAMKLKSRATQSQIAQRSKTNYNRSGNASQSSLVRNSSTGSCAGSRNVKMSTTTLDESKLYPPSIVRESTLEGMIVDDADGYDGASITEEFVQTFDRKNSTHQY